MFRPLLDIYILAATGYCLTGWGLSLLRWLNPFGYLAASFCIAAAILCYLRKYYLACPKRLAGHGWRFRRFRRWLPASFVVLAVLILGGGLMHEPNNHDGLSYRIPRVLHWLDHQAWFWTGNFDVRMDTRSAGFEWLSAPFLALLRSDRLIFLWNWLGFLFLPSLVFQLCRRIGATGRAAWTWMWLAPSAYGVVLQAGSIGNDFIGAVFFLTSLNLASIPGLATRRDWVLSGLSISLCAGIKSTNLLWGLPWVLLLAASGRWRNLLFPWLTPLLLVFFLNASLPIFVSNHLYGRSWSGANLEHSEGKPVTAADPLLGITGNFILLALQNCAPPAWPWIKETIFMIRQSLPFFLLDGLSKTFEGGFTDLGIRELPAEEGAGLGMGLMACIIFSLIYGLKSKKPKKCNHRPLLLAGWGGVCAILVYSATLAMSCPARILLPGLFFLLIFVSALPGQNHCVQTLFMRILIIAAILSSFSILMVNPARPLVPIPGLLKIAERLGLPYTIQQRMGTVYSTYARRARAFEPLLKEIPIDQKNLPLGYTGGAGLEASLWKPYGTRSVVSVDLLDYESPPSRALPSLIVAAARFVPKSSTPSSLSWVQARDAEILAEKEILFQARIGLEKFFLLRLPQ